MRLPRWRFLIATGIWLGLAQATKFSALVYLPILVLVFLHCATMASATLVLPPITGYWGAYPPYYEAYPGYPMPYALPVAQPPVITAGEK